jgi:hypothetical protein
MVWLIVGLFGLILLGALVVLARRRGSHRRGADDTLVTELLGPRDVAAVPAPQTGEEAERSPVPQATKAGESSVPPSGQGAEGDWLETQLAWITSWSRQIHQQIESAGRPGTDRTE